MGLLNGPLGDVRATSLRATAVNNSGPTLSQSRRDVKLSVSDSSELPQYVPGKAMLRSGTKQHCAGKMKVEETRRSGLCG